MLAFYCPMVQSGLVMVNRTWFVNIFPTILGWYIRDIFQHFQESLFFSFSDLSFGFLSFSVIEKWGERKVNEGARVAFDKWTRRDWTEWPILKTYLDLTTQPKPIPTPWSRSSSRKSSRWRTKERKKTWTWNFEMNLIVSKCFWEFYSSLWHYSRIKNQFTTFNQCFRGKRRGHTKAEFWKKLLILNCPFLGKLHEFYWDEFLDFSL